MKSIKYLKKYVYFIFVTLCLIPMVTSHGQSIKTKDYRKAKLYLDNHRILKVKDLKVTQSEVRFFNIRKERQEFVAISEVELIKIPKGNHLWQGALIGAGTAALTALLIDLQPDPLGLPEEDRGAGFYAGFTLGGAVLGGLIGFIIPKWKSIFSKGKFLNGDLPVDLGFSSKNNAFNLKIKIAL